MDFHDVLKLAGGIGALALFVPMAVRIIKDDGAGQSFATWFLWATLDTILTVSLFLQHGNYLLPLGFAAGGIALTVSVAGQRAIRLEPHGQRVFGAGARLPGRLENRVGPRRPPSPPRWGFAWRAFPGWLSCGEIRSAKWETSGAGTCWPTGLSFLGGTAMTLEERFAPAVFAVFSALMVVAGFRKTPGGKPGIKVRLQNPGRGPGSLRRSFSAGVGHKIVCYPAPVLIFQPELDTRAAAR